MLNRRLIIAPLLLGLLFTITFVLAKPDRALGQFTIPTRTPASSSPTDPPPQATDNNSGGGGNGGDNQPSPSNTPQPVNTAVPPTNTATVVSAVQSPTSSSTNTAVTPSQTALANTTTVQPTATASPSATPEVETSFLEAGPCGEPPTITTITTTNVYDGLGSNYLVSSTLGPGEVRPIAGRAAYATWWLIQLDNDSTLAWINDKAGTVHGFTGNVPIIEVTSDDGVQPTPGEQWNPTPNPICTPTSTPTSDGNVISGSLEDDSSSSAAKVNTITDSSMAADQRSQIAESVSPLELEVPTTSPTPNLLPIAGLVLVVAAVFIALFLRRNSSGSGPGT